MMSHPIDRIKTIDAHVSGEPIRVILPDALNLHGNTIYEKRDYFAKNLDYLRQALILEPRGHENMFGAVVCETHLPGADFGLFFMDTGGYLNMCGHGTIGTVTVLLESNLVILPPHSLVIETPSGLIEATVKTSGGKPLLVSFKNVPAFVYQKDIKIRTSDFGTLSADIVFSGNFFIMVDANQLSCDLSALPLNLLITQALSIRADINNRLDIRHPTASHIHSADLVQFYQITGDHQAKNCVVFGKGQIDRSPCGTGVSGLLALMHHTRRLDLGMPIICESVLGTTFSGKVSALTTVDPFEAIIPEITGTGHITGHHEFILGADDPFNKGFLVNPNAA